MARNVRDVCIVGIGETEYRKWGSITDRSELGLACEAIKAAAADAGVETDEIDGLASYAYDHSEPYMLQETLGLPNLNYAAMVWGGGGNGSFGSIALAYSAIRAGHVDCVAVFRSLCQGQTFRFGQGYPTAHQNFIHPFGMLSPPLMFAPVAQRYKHLYGVRDEQFGEVALVCRDNASRNPRAVFRDRPLTMTDYLQSRMIADPLRLYDCCQENDGACALILTTLERARDLRQKPVAVLAAGHGGDPGRGSGPLGFHNMPDEIYAHGDGRCATGRHRRRADIRRLYTTDSDGAGELWVLRPRRRQGLRVVGRHSLARWRTADQHLRWPAFGSLYPWPQSRRRRSPPVARPIDFPGTGCGAVPSDLRHLGRDTGGMR